ncbi:MAG TPA: hypothetical protein VK454_00685 [Myxococcaceae bacterium]|nr:hypothetical protein [Myxococcaceae bacterium]
MRRLLVLALVAAGLYFAWTRFGPAKVSPLGDTTPAKSTSDRIDRLSGAAPQ